MRAEGQLGRTPMDAVELARLRRFALAAGIILLTYALAAVELDVGETVRPLGVPLRISHPEWLGIGIAAAAAYGMLRFWYYGVMTSESPAARRRRVLADAGIGRDFSAVREINVPDHNRDSLTQHFQGAFPRVLGASVTLSLAHPDDTARDVQETLGFDPVPQVKSLNVPMRVRVAMWCEQADYTAPIWFNIAALATWGYRVTAA